MGFIGGWVGVPRREMGCGVCEVRMVASPPRRRGGKEHRVARTGSAWCGSSRHPETWEEVVEQACEATEAVLKQGTTRVLIEARHDAGGLTMKGRLMGAKEAMMLAMGLAEVLERRLGTGTIAVFYSTEEEVKDARSLLPHSLREVIRVASLTSGKWEVGDVAAVLVAPCNTLGKPHVIEAVQLLHYDGWRDIPRPVVMVNPKMMALTAYSLQERRPPTFMVDYTHAYYVNTRVFANRVLSGSLLYWFPRKWELYLKYTNNGDIGHRLVSQHEERPSREKITGELMWRADAASRKHWQEGDRL